MDVVTTARELLPDARAFVWADWDYDRDDTGKRAWHPCDPPQPGDTVYPSALREDATNTIHGTHPSPVTLVEVPCTTSGDYVGSAIEASNRRALLRDFPDTFVTVAYDMGAETLTLPADREVSEALADAIEGLADYPLYDEEEHSLVELEWAADAWDRWLGDDIHRAIRSELADQESALAKLDTLGDEWLREEFYRLAHDAPYGPEDEGMGEGNIRFPFAGDHVRELSGMIRRMLAPAVVARMLERHPAGVGQLAVDGGELA